jgi:hypothetical protein
VTDQERAESFLRKHTGRFFCTDCLAQELGLTVFETRSLMRKVQAQPSFERRDRKCANCARGKRPIGHVGDFATLNPTAQVVVFLLGNKDIYVCDGCVAFATELSLAEVRNAIASVEGLAEFERRDGACTVCSRVRRLICAVPIDDADAEPVAQPITGTAPYRGWRIELLSYQTRAGWRPFVLIKAPVGVLCAAVPLPDAPGLLCCTLPSKVEADQRALTVAKEWIDKHWQVAVNGTRTGHRRQHEEPAR